MSDKTPGQDPSHLVWMDLEMTGLDATQDVIVQAALIITNKHLEKLDTLTIDIWQPEESLQKMVPFVRQMHEKTGLLERVRTSTVDVTRAGQMLLEKVTEYCPFHPVLCGNTIHSDRKFIDRYWPGLSAYLHYRMVDVTSLKVLSQLWLPSDRQYKKSDSRQHDALFDIEQSISELKHYRRELMKLG